MPILITNILLVCAGLGCLTLASDWLIRASVTLAARFNVSLLVIGLTLVAFATSAPELVISIDAAVHNLPDIIIGNVIGSNIANILLILGVSSALMPPLLKTQTIRIDGAMLLMVSLWLGVLAYYGVFSRSAGALGLIALAFYILYIYRAARADTQTHMHDVIKETKKNIMRGNIIWILITLTAAATGLYIGAELLIKGASTIARYFGVSDAVIGLTLVAIGTSLPELAVAIAAIVRRHMGIVIGNVIGSNIANILLVLGITAIIQPISITSSFVHRDIWIMLAATIAMLALLNFDKKIIHRLWGCIAIITYVTYIYVIF